MTILVYSIASLFFITGRMPRSGKLPVLFLLRGQKSGYSPRRGDSMHRFTSNFAGPTVRLAVQTFTSIGAVGWECGLKNIKNFHFLVKSPMQGRLPWPISKIFRGFHMFNNLTLVFQISSDSHHRLRSYRWETARHSIRPNFSAQPVGKTIRWIKKWISTSWMVSTSSITVQILGKIAQCAPAVGAKMRCLLFLCNATRPERCSLEGYIVRTGIALPFVGRFGNGFQCFP